MERGYNNQRGGSYGGNYGGEPAYRNTQAQASETQSVGTGSNIVARANRFLEENDLHTKITMESMYNREIEGEEFIPQKALRDIWRNRLHEFLSILGCRPNDQDLRYIRDNLLKILSILVAIEWTEWNKFHNIFLARVEDSFPRRSDESIPFPLYDLQDDSFLGRRMGGKFWKEQSAFIPIVIEEGLDKEYPARKRLPFIYSERKHLGTGSYGSVTKEVIAVHQFKWNTSQNLNDDLKPVARKRLTAYGDFKKETRNLLDLNSCISEHKHIVGYIAIIVIGDDASPKDLNILLPLASMNLQHLLYSKDPVPPDFQIADLLEQASNVADAIQWLHAGLRIGDRELVCCHMDLKLDNILVYYDNEEPVGKWKISDFGISTLKDKERDKTRAVRRQSSERLNVPGLAKTFSSPAESLARLTKTARMAADRPPAIYQAPEVFRGNMIGRSSDVWSFGCILFQILARGVGPGVDKLEELDELRRLEEDKVTGHATDFFFREGRAGCYLNPHVKAWLEEGFSDRSYSDHEIVKACKRLILDILKIDPTRRLKAKAVNSKLYDIWRGPLSDSMSEHQSQSSISRRMSAGEQVPEISVSSFVETPNPRDEPRLTQRAPSGSSFAPSASASQPFETWQQMRVTSVTPPPDPQGPSQPDFIGGLQSFPPPNSYQPYATPVFPVQSGQNLNMASLPLHRKAEPPPQPVVDPPLAGGLQVQTQDGPDSRPTNFRHSPPSTGTNPNPIDRRSASHSSHRSHSLASSAESRVSAELVPCDRTPFTTVRNVLQTFVSPTTTNLAYITENSIFIRTACTPYSYLTIKTDNIKWECGSMAGDFITAIGKEKTSKQRTFRLYKVSTNGVLQEPQSLRVVDPPSYYTYVAVSKHGRLIFQGRNGAWLYGYWWGLYLEHEVFPANSLPSNDTEKQELKITSPETSRSQLEALEMICFSNDGVWVFAVTPLPGNLHRIRVWYVGDVMTSTYYDYQHERRESTSPIKYMIPFPKSPYCILWAEYDRLSILSGGTQTNRQPFPVENLQALVITPDEKAIIFITGTTVHGRRRSKISFSRLQNDNGGFSLSKQSAGEFLERPLNNPSKCAVAIQNANASEDLVTVLIAYCDGNCESKQVTFRNSG